ncbi:MAG: SUMF1/EgtB/PvdO family nonheme iron enzyme [Candidatus Delongbacteria bacterium]
MNCHICKKEQRASLLEYPRIGGICEKCATRLVTGWLFSHKIEVQKLLQGEVNKQNDFHGFVILNSAWVREKLGIQGEIIEHKNVRGSSIVGKNHELINRGLMLLETPLSKNDDLLLDNKEIFSHLKLKLVKIPEGELDCEIIGDNSKAGESQTKKLNSFYICETPITVQNIIIFYEENGFRSEAENGGTQDYALRGGIYAPSFSSLHWTKPKFIQNSHHPVTCLSIHDMYQYINWINRKTRLNFRLPTKIEWVYAALGGSKNDPYGNIDEIAWFTPEEKWFDEVGYFGHAPPKKLGSDHPFWENKYNWGKIDSKYWYPEMFGTKPVKAKNPNNFGLYDMLGNVWEICCPDVKKNGFFLCGGSWGVSSDYCKARSCMFYPTHVLSTRIFNDVGFRLALDINPNELPHL